MHLPASRAPHSFPVAPALRCRYRITGGSKFGSDFLLYPGDPTLFHAQFCVRLLPLRAPLLPPLLAAACRGSHQARKHLLLASVEEGAAGAGAGAGAAGEVSWAFCAHGCGLMRALAQLLGVAQAR